MLKSIKVLSTALMLAGLTSAAAVQSSSIVLPDTAAADCEFIRDMFSESYNTYK